MSWKTRIPARFVDFGNKVLHSDNYVFGIKLVAIGGGSGTWMYIDENENIVDLPDRYFEGHPTYKAITEKKVDENIFAQIPAFFIRTGENKFWIAPDPRNSSLTDVENKARIDELKSRGFRLHPAFLTGNVAPLKEIYDYILIGSYQMSVDANNKARSKADVLPCVNVTPTSYSTYCTNNNVNGVKGYHMWTIYELSAIQMLMMLECKSTNFQKFYGRGRVNENTEGVGRTSDATSNGPASARWSYGDKKKYGIYGLWGNAWQLVDGIKTDNNNMLCLFDNNGINTYGTTAIKLPSRSKTTWTWGEDRGYYTKTLNEVGARYDTSDMFIPDFSSLTEIMERGTFSDCVYCPTGSLDKLCAVGGAYNSEDEAGLFAYNFDIDLTTTYDNVTSRLAKY